MGFTIKCNKCGNEQEFKQNDRLWQDKIQLEVELRGTYEQIFDQLTIYCENEKCNQWIELK